MATIGNAASGADYAADDGALQSWEDVTDNSSGDYTGELITDIQDTCDFSTTNATTTYIIKSDTTGTKRKITAAAGSPASSYPLRFGTGASSGSALGNVTLEDLILDGATLCNNCFYIRRSISTAAFTVKRCQFINSKVDLYYPYNDDIADTTFENCIFNDSGRYGAFITTHAYATHNQFKNCLFANNVNSDIRCQDDADQTVTFMNCLFMNHGGTAGQAIIIWTGGANVHVHECVFSDDTLTDTTFDTEDNCVENKSSYTSYFNNWASDDFTLKDDDNSLWGIDGDSANTPAEDYDNVTRTSDDIGPYEYVAPPAPTLFAGQQIIDSI
jgi:hypothetical protein